jgi:hypothetical protein
MYSRTTIIKNNKSDKTGNNRKEKALFSSFAHFFIG